MLLKQPLIVSKIMFIYLSFVYDILRPLHVHFVNNVHLIWTVSWLIGYKLGQIHDILAKTGTQLVDMGVRFKMSKIGKKK